MELETFNQHKQNHINYYKGTRIFRMNPMNKLFKLKFQFNLEELENLSLNLFRLSYFNTDIFEFKQGSLKVQTINDKIVISIPKNYKNKKTLILDRLKTLIARQLVINEALPYNFYDIDLDKPLIQEPSDLFYKVLIINLSNHMSKLRVVDYMLENTNIEPDILCYYVDLLHL